MSIFEYLNSLIIDFDCTESTANDIFGWEKRHTRFQLNKDEWELILARNWYCTNDARKKLQEQFPSSLLLQPHKSSEYMMYLWLNDFNTYTIDRIVDLLPEDVIALSKLNKHTDISTYLQNVRIRNFTSFLVNDCNIKSILVPSKYTRTTKEFSEFIVPFFNSGWVLESLVFMDGRKVLPPTSMLKRGTDLVYSLIHR